MAILTFFLASGVLAGCIAWLTLRWLQGEYARYRASFKHEAVRGLSDFFLFMDPGQLWMANILLAAVPAIIAASAGGHWIWAAAVGGVFLWLPRAVLGWARRRRLRRIDEQLPDFLLAVAGALRAGSGLQAGMRQVVPHTEAPLSQELGLLLQQQRMGLAFNDALDALQVRVNTEAVGLVVAAIKVAGHTGGSLAETLERISATVRMRLQLLAKVRALTSQGRMQAWIMAALPAVLAWALYVLDPATMTLLWSSPSGWAVVLLVVLLEAMGVYFVRRIVSIEV